MIRVIVNMLYVYINLKIGYIIDGLRNVNLKYLKWVFMLFRNKIIILIKFCIFC